MIKPSLNLVFGSNFSKSNDDNVEIKACQEGLVIVCFFRGWFWWSFPLSDESVFITSSLLVTHCSFSLVWE